MRPFAIFAGEVTHPLGTAPTRQAYWPMFGVWMFMSTLRPSPQSTATCGTLTQPLNRLGFLLMLVITLIHTKFTRMGDVAPSLFLQNPLQ
jgi:hypothetical protein